MLNLLLVDSWIHSRVIKQDIITYFEQNGIEYNYFEAQDSDSALEVLKNNQIDLAYIDIASKKINGLDILSSIVSLGIKVPQIVGVTNLNDTEFRFKALKLGVYKYIYKPYDNKEIEHSVKKFVEEVYVKKAPVIEEDQNIEEESDEFMDFDDEEDDFFDFDEEEDENGIEHSQELMDAYNDSHKKVTAEEFLASYSEGEIDTEELYELEEQLDSLIAFLLFESRVEEKLDEIIYLLEKYNRFLYMFSEFEELGKVLYGLVELLNETDFSAVERKEMASKFIVAIIDDLVNWKEHVFVLKDAVDVYYINASILNSYVQLKDIIK